MNLKKFTAAASALALAGCASFSNKSSDDSRSSITCAPHDHFVTLSHTKYLQEHFRESVGSESESAHITVWRPKDNDSDLRIITEVKKADGITCFTANYHLQPPRIKQP